MLGDASEAALLRYVDSLTPIFEFKARPRMGGREEGMFDGPFTMGGEKRACLTGLSPISARSPQVQMSYQTLFEVPFNSVNKWALALTADPENPASHIAMMKVGRRWRMRVEEEGGASP